MSLYYSFSLWDDNMKIIAFYQAIGAGLPVLVGIFTASVMEQEQNAGNFQNMLSLSKKGGDIYIEADAVTDALSWLCLIDCFDIWNWIWNDISKW